MRLSTARQWFARARGNRRTIHKHQSSLTYSGSKIKTSAILSASFLNNVTQFCNA